MSKQVTFFLICMTLLMINSPLMAQKGLKVGGFVSPHVSFLVNDNDATLTDDEFRRELLPGVSGGFIFGYNPSTYFGLRANLIISQQGGRYSVRNNFFDRIEYTTRLNYVKLPLMIGLNSNHINRKIMFHIYSGFQFGFLTRAWTYDDDTNFIPPLPSNFTDYPDTYATYEAVNYSMVLDLGIDVKILRDVTMNLHIRGDHSLFDAEDKEETFRFTNNGFTQEVNYWEFIRGVNDGGPPTKNITLGLLFGITYTITKD